MAGFFGKIPSHGDFITRDLPRSFLDGWDTWLQSCIAQSKTQLGGGWLDVYLTSPIWRFALMPGICGPETSAGVLMPSVDRVGRYFPLTIAASLPRETNPMQLPGTADRWFDEIESVALRALDDDRFEANAMHDALKAIGDVRVEGQRPETAATMGAAWSLILVGSHAPALPSAFAHALAQRQAAAYSLWWTAGVQAPAALLVAGLPEPGCFVELLHGAQASEAAAAPRADHEPAVEAALQ